MDSCFARILTQLLHQFSVSRVLNSVWYSINGPSTPNPIRPFGQDLTTFRGNNFQPWMYFDQFFLNPTATSHLFKLLLFSLENRCCSFHDVVHFLFPPCFHRWVALFSKRPVEMDSFGPSQILVFSFLNFSNFLDDLPELAARNRLCTAKSVQRLDAKQHTQTVNQQRPADEISTAKTFSYVAESHLQVAPGMVMPLAAKRRRRCGTA